MNPQNYARMCDIFLSTTFFWQNYGKWFHQIISHNQVHMISKKLNCSSYFSSNFINFFCTLPHLGSSVIQYHLYASALFISLKSIKCSLLEYKRYIDICNHKNLTKLKKKNLHLLRTSIPIGVWNLKWKYLNTQNIWVCLWNNSVKLVLTFPFGLRSSDSTVNLQTVVSRSWATQAAAVDVSKTFDRVNMLVAILMRFQVGFSVLFCYFSVIALALDNKYLQEYRRCYSSRLHLWSCAFPILF